jgi:hypothetical protein
MKLSISFLIIFFVIILNVNYSFSQSSSSVSTKIDIEWEPIESYTHPFYEGRALSGEESDIKAVAVVEIETLAGKLDPKKLFYTWNYNGYYVHNFSKTGGDNIRFTLDQLQNTNTLEVKVFSNNRQEMLLGEKTIYIKPKQSLLIVYRSDANPILMYANAINKKYEPYIVEKGESLDVQVSPFFFSVSSPQGSTLNYLWSLNGITSNTAKDVSFSYTVPNKISKDRSIGIKVSNDKKLLQEGESLVNLDIR